MPPVIILFVAVVLVLTQLFHMLFPKRIGYLWRLVLATFGVLLGEAVAQRIVPGGPRLGELHPAWDIGFVTALQLLGNRVLA
jgi:hypothetical protein